MFWSFVYLFNRKNTSETHKKIIALDGDQKLQLVDLTISYAQKPHDLSTSDFQIWSNKTDNLSKSVFIRSDIGFPFDNRDMKKRVYQQFAAAS